MNGPIRIVVADDAAETRTNIRRLLELTGTWAVVGEAADGREALEVCRATRPDCVLLDVNMPRMDGFTATRSILSEAPHVKVVLMSVDNHPHYPRKARAAGACAFLPKPLSVDDLLEAVLGSRPSHARI